MSSRVVTELCFTCGDMKLKLILGLLMTLLGCTRFLFDAIVVSSSLGYTSFPQLLSGRNIELLILWPNFNLFFYTTFINFYITF